MLREHLETIQRVCFDEKASAKDLELLGSPERWQIYRRMVRSRLIELIHVAIPRTIAAIGQEAIGVHIDRWLAETAPRTRYFREVPTEFVAFALPALEEDDEPWLADLARYEIAQWDVKHGPPNRRDATQFSFDRPPVMNAALRILRLSYPVHEKPTPEEGYQPVETLLCVYRGASHKPITWTLNAMAADLVESWIPGERTVAECVQAVAVARGSGIDEKFIEGLSAMIADFLERGILIGTQPSPGGVPDATSGVTPPP